MKKSILVVVLLLIPFFSSNSEILTIINKGNYLNNVSKEEIKSLYLMKRKRTYEGDVVHLFQFPSDSKIHIDFIRNNLDMSVETYKKEIEKINNSGSGKKITVVESKEEMLEAVGLTYNGLGYIDKATLIINRGGSNVKIFNIVD